MNASVSLPSQFHWTPQQLAHAVPLRLSEMFDFDAARACAMPAAANAAHPRTRIASGYLSSAALPVRFRIF
ncbi:MAG: hypothetical protein QM612_08005 [Thermomonas sp.]|uniref:hypothetical protein n=1 Tax=Thermomonas sp. TaxID=1971895 RepID=UPI0039E3430E